MYAATQYEGTNRIIEYAVGKDASITSSHARSPIVRSQMGVGYPLEGYDAIDKKQDKQDKELDKYLRDVFIKKADKYYRKGAGGMDFYYASGRIISLYITGQVFADIALAIGSLIFIFLFMWFQTRTLFVTCFGLFGIMNGFIITDVIYIGVLQIKYLGIFHVLSLFIVLGIGADDLFVFMDTWREAGHRSWPSLAHRLDHTFRHAGLAMLYTSLTTALAFFVSAASPFLAINSFGVFSGLLILINYISVVVFFPTCVMMHHVYFNKYKCCCCCAKQEDPNQPSDKKSLVVRFFAGPYFRFITHKVIRWVIVGVFTVFIAIMVYFITQVEVQEEQVRA